VVKRKYSSKRKTILEALKGSATSTIRVQEEKELERSQNGCSYSVIHAYDTLYNF
jgi:hypothetical protein